MFDRDEDFNVFLTLFPLPLTHGFDAIAAFREFFRYGLPRLFNVIVAPEALAIICPKGPQTIELPQKCRRF